MVKHKVEYKLYFKKGSGIFEMYVVQLERDYIVFFTRGKSLSKLFFISIIRAVWTIFFFISPLHLI